MNHYPTCRRCGNSGPGVAVKTKQGKKKIVCAWCLEKLRSRIAKRSLAR